LELGARHRRYLWRSSYYPHPWNAHSQDKLDNRAFCKNKKVLVCAAACLEAGAARDRADWNRRVSVVNRAVREQFNPSTTLRLATLWQGFIGGPLRGFATKLLGAGR